MTVNKTGQRGADHSSEDCVRARRLSSAATGRTMLEQRRALAMLGTLLAWQRHSAT